ncbi:MAG: DUF5915 domain-containing protein, partial [Clostridiales bacterium]|nr:DUF5915 domain-containing protein [Clostridiales bacterium]
VTDTESFVDYRFKPQLKTVGPKYGKLLPKIQKALLSADGSKLMEELKSSGSVSIPIDDRLIELAETDLLIETLRKEGYQAVSERDITVALDTNLTQTLIEEGFAREIVSKVQTMRKEAGFKVTDRIALCYKGGSKISNVFLKYKDSIADDVLANEITEQSGNNVAYVLDKEWDINGEPATMWVRKI